VLRSLGRQGSAQNDAHAGGLRALLALADLELDALALVEDAESPASNSE
jgi:hypothetical protein